MVYATQETLAAVAAAARRAVPSPDPGAPTDPVAALERMVFALALADAMVMLGLSPESVGADAPLVARYLAEVHGYDVDAASGPVPPPTAPLGSMLELRTHLEAVAAAVSSAAATLAAILAEDAALSARCAKACARLDRHLSRYASRAEMDRVLDAAERIGGSEPRTPFPITEDFAARIRTGMAQARRGHVVEVGSL
jgi:hypothetical protein